MINPNHEELDNYFIDIAYRKSGELRQEKDGKAGCTLLFYYVGHGVIDKSYTSIVLNQEFQDTENPYQIEAKLRFFTAIPNSFVFGSLNCCRKTFIKPLSENSSRAENINH